MITSHPSFIDQNGSRVFSSRSFATQSSIIIPVLLFFLLLRHPLLLHDPHHLEYGQGDGDALDDEEDEEDEESQSAVFPDEVQDALEAADVHPTVLTIRFEKAALPLHGELLKVSAYVVPS